jgi:uncharacterized membrane protein HdeD (DUF308 family)
MAEPGSPCSVAAHARSSRASSVVGMIFDFADPNQVLLYWVIVITISILSLVLTFLFFYWIIRQGVYHGMRSFRRWERSGEE